MRHRTCEVRVNQSRVARATRLRGCNLWNGIRRVAKSCVAVLAALCQLTASCGDGIGRPIRLEVSAGGTSGTAAWANGGAGLFGVAPFAGAGAGLPIDTTITASDYCSATQNWPVVQSTAEENLLAALNQLRLSGQVGCVTGSTVIAPPLVMSDQLRCSSRLNSLVMAQSGSLTTFAGDIGTQMALAGYAANRFAEVITTSAPTNVDVASLLIRLVSSGGTDCANLLDPSFTSVGVGFTPGSTQGYWTVDLASP